MVSLPPENFFFFLHHLIGCWRQKHVKLNGNYLFFSNNNVSCQKLQKYILYLIFFVGSLFQKITWSPHHVWLLLSCVSNQISCIFVLDLCSSRECCSPTASEILCSGCKAKDDRCFLNLNLPQTLFVCFFNFFSSLNIFLFFQALRASSATCLPPC